MDDHLKLEPIDSDRGGEPVVSDVNGRLWRVGTRPSVAVDVLLAALILVLFAAIAAALIL
jgi:hypothetical protein